MSSVLDAIRIRRCYPVKEVPGAFVRSLTRAEWKRVKEIDTDISDELLFGFALTDEKGNPEFTQGKDESDETFANRLLAYFEDVDTKTRRELGNAIIRVGQVPTHEDIAKNSETTRQPA